jgi:hypothetical protein
MGGYGSGGFGLGGFGVGATTTTTTLAPGTFGAGVVSGGLKKMPAHAVQMQDERTFADHIRDYRAELNQKTLDVSEVEKQAQILFSQQKHAAVNQGGHLASHIVSEQDLSSTISLQDYINEVKAAKGPYSDLRTAVSVALGKTIVRKWNNEAAYKKEIITGLDYKSDLNKLILSKTFVKAKEISNTVVPVLTQQTESTDPVVVTSKFYNSPAVLPTSYGWQLFDGDPNTIFSIPNSGADYTATGWVQVKLPEVKKVVYYKITPYGSTSWSYQGYYGRYYLEDPSSWVLQGSQDGVNWTNLDSRSISFDRNPGLADYSKLLYVDSPGYYRYYRLNLTGPGAWGTSIKNIELYEYYVNSAGKNIDRNLVYDFADPDSSSKWILNNGRLEIKPYPDGNYPRTAIYLSEKLQAPGNKFGDGAIGRFNWDQTGSNVAFQVRSEKAPSGSENIAVGKTVTSNFTRAASSTATFEKLTDGSISNLETVNYNLTESGATSDGDYPWVQVDLGKVFRLNSIKVFHYYPNSGVLYYDSILETSEDGVNWQAVFASGRHGESPLTYAESSQGKTHSLNARRVRYVREKIRGYSSGNSSNTTQNFYNQAIEARWAEIQVYPLSFDELDWDQIKRGQDLYTSSNHQGNDWFQYKIILEGQNPLTKEYSESITLDTESSTNLNINTKELNYNKTSGEWISKPYTIDKDFVKLKRLNLSYTGSINWTYRTGIMSATGILWDDWKTVPSSGNVEAFNKLSYNIVQLKANMQRLTVLDPSPTITSAQATYNATVYAVTPSVRNVRMNNYIQTFQGSGQIQIVLDTQSTGTVFKRIKWNQILPWDTGISVQARASDTYPFDEQNQSFEIIRTAGEGINQIGRYVDVRFVLSSFSGDYTSKIYNLEIEYELYKNYESNRNIQELFQDTIKTNFELKRKTLYNEQKLYRMFTDVFEDTSGIGPGSYNYSYNGVAKYIYSPRYEATLVTPLLPVNGLINNFISSISYDPGSDGLIRMEYSFDNGTSWNKVNSFDLKISLDTPVENPQLKLKFLIYGTAKLYGWVFAY